VAPDPSSTALGQSTPPNTYYANDGTNTTQDNGELATDVLGNIPFSLEAASLYGTHWNATSPSSLTRCEPMRPT